MPDKCLVHTSLLGSPMKTSLHFIAKKVNNYVSKSEKAVFLQICFNKGLIPNGFLIIFGSSLQFPLKYKCRHCAFV